MRDSIKRAEAQLLEMEERLGLAKRFREMRDGFEAIRAAAQDIQEYNDRYGYSREIDERAQTDSDPVRSSFQSVIISQIQHFVLRGDHHGL